jgi:hypothetical protein
LLRDWFARAGIHIEAYKIFRRDDTVVVEQRARWQVSAAGTADAPQTVASVFVVQHGRGISVIRHADLESALKAGGLTHSDRV